jgi:hypothetical protein
MNKKTITKGLVAALAATTFIGGFAAATDASAQSRRGGWNRGGHYNHGYSRGYYGHNRGWNSGRSLALGAAIGAAVAGGAYYGRGYYGRGYYGPGYGYYGGGPGYYGYGYGATCVRRVWDPYIGRWVRTRTWC